MTRSTIALEDCQELDWINDYVGVPYRENGRDRAGWDCWGLVLAVYRERLGLNLPDWQWQEPFGLSARFRAFAAAMDDVNSGAEARELAAPEPLAIALVLHQGRSWPHHVGVVAGAGVLHAARFGGTLWEPYPRFLKSYPGVTWWRWRR